MDSSAQMISEEMLAIMRSSKEVVVDAKGVGSDLSLSLFCVRDGDIIAYCQQIGQAGDLNHIRLLQALTLIRWHYGIDAVIVGTEGYATFRQAEEVPDDLNKRFAEGDASIVECLSVIYQNAKEMSFTLSNPYTYSTPRKVEWGEIEYLKNTDAVRGPLPFIVHQAFLVGVAEHSTEEDAEVAQLNDATIYKTLEELGFFMISRDEFKVSFRDK